MNSGTKAWAFQDQSQRDDFAESLFSCLPMDTMKLGLGGIISNGYAVVVGSVLFPRRGLANVQPDRQDLCTTIPLAARCIYPSGIMPVNAKLLLVAR